MRTPHLSMGGSHRARSCAAGLILGACIFSGAAFAASQQAPGSLRDVDAMVAQMSLDEKIGQMTQTDLNALHEKSDIEKYFLGSVLSGGGHSPKEIDANAWRQCVEDIRGYALKTRLQIPILYGIDAVHGHNNVDGAVIFPHNIGIGATRDTALAERAARVVADELAATDIQWAFAPCIAVAQNERWGRTYESFSESTDLVSQFGAAMIRGFQGRKLSDSSPSLACAKHFLADGGTTNGKDQGDAVCDEEMLRRVFLPPYAAAIKAGAESIMVSYSSWNGVKMHANKHLLTDVLKGEMKFKGFLVSDWAAIDQISSDYKADVEASINAGVDMVMVPYGPGEANNYQDFIRDVKGLVAEGKIPQSRVDDAVTRVLRVKYQMGMFKPGNNRAVPADSVGSTAHREVARECVRESLVLLKNNRRALPLSKSIKHLCVIGEAADDMGVQCGGWTISWQGQAGQTIHGGTTILSAIRNSVEPGVDVQYSAAGDISAGAEAVMVVIGEKPYAEMKGDRPDLTIPAHDVALVEKAQKTGAPVITLLLSGRPLVLGSVFDSSDAIVAAWLPGTEGEGVADVLFGDYKPAGKLPRAWPLDNSQLSTTATRAGKPLFPFGFGLTYKPLTASSITRRTNQVTSESVRAELRR